MLTRREALIGGAITTAALAAACKPTVSGPAAAGGATGAKDGSDADKLEREEIKLVAPPFVHAHDQVAKGGPKVKAFTMTIEEKQMVIDPNGTKVWAMTFNGSVPGPMMVVHEGDYVELTLVNPATNQLSHNIDFHSSTGALGGGDLTHVNPGEQTVLRWKATRAGVFVYHCAPGGEMIPWHVTSGMNGAVMVLPRDGLKDAAGKALHYDKVIYIGEQDYYVPKDGAGNFKSFGTVMEGFNDTLKTMKGLIPSHVVFNGAVGALTGDKAVPAKVGETVLIIHAQANRDSRPHLIGGHGDYVWEHGKFNNPPVRDMETWFIRGGSAGAALYTFLQPGLYVYLNHNLIEAVLLGAAMHIKVEGEWNNDLMKQVQKGGPISRQATPTPNDSAPAQPGVSGSGQVVGEGTTKAPATTATGQIAPKAASGTTAPPANGAPAKPPMQH